MAHELASGLLLYLVLALSIALHEFGHAKVADLVGDPLPRLQGRVTLNPLVHLDPIGTGLIPLTMIMLPILTGASLPVALIGWGRPVQIALNNPRTRVRDEILITIAGPAMNILIAIVVSVAAGLFFRFFGDTSSADSIWDLTQTAIYLNCLLVAFNLIPLPPLDGSRILRHLVGMSEETFFRLAANAPWILLILVNIHQFQLLLYRVTAALTTPFLAIVNHLAA